MATKDRSAHIQFARAPVVQATCSIQLKDRYGISDIEDLRRTCKELDLNQETQKDVFYIEFSNQDGILSKVQAYEFKSIEGDRAVGITTNVLSIQRLGNYKSWSKYLSFIRQVTGPLKEKEDNLQRLSLRKTNSFLIEDDVSNLHKYFKNYLIYSEFFTGDNSRFIFNKSFEDNLQLQCNVNIKKAAEKLHIINNIEISKNLVNSNILFRDRIEIETLLDTMNDYLYQAFIGLVTPGYLQTFEPINDVTSND